MYWQDHPRPLTPTALKQAFAEPFNIKNKQPQLSPPPGPKSDFLNLRTAKPQPQQRIPPKNPPPLNLPHVLRQRLFVTHRPPPRATASTGSIRPGGRPLPGPTELRAPEPGGVQRAGGVEKMVATFWNLQNAGHPTWRPFSKKHLQTVLKSWWRLLLFHCSLFSCVVVFFFFRGDGENRPKEL